MLFAADDSVSGTFVCFDFAKSSDCGSVFFWIYAWKEGMFIGFFSGLLIDLFFGDVLGFYALLYMYVGYVNGFFRAIFFQDDIKLPMLLISASDLACNLCIYFFRFLFRKQFDIGYYFLHLMIPELVYTLLVTILLYWLILKINQWLEKSEKRSEAKFV